MTLNTLLDISEELAWMGRELIEELSFVACAPEIEGELMIDDESIWVPMEDAQGISYVPAGFKNFTVIPRRATVLRLLKEIEEEDIGRGD